ncbi:MAG: LamG domain-containing protein [Sedimentisphaerales bacterium]|nr:LamG domain-containing protein [Sedimentisphaerales bacterium]
MSKKLCILISFVLVLGLCGKAQAEVEIRDIEVINYSFELDGNGDQVCGHTGDLGIGWEVKGMWIGQDVNCASPVFCMDCDPNDPESEGGECNCKMWPASDGHIMAYMQTNDIYFAQMLDETIQARTMYTLKMDAITWDPDVRFTASVVYQPTGGSPVDVVSKEIWLEEMTEDDPIGWEEYSVVLVVPDDHPAVVTESLLGIKFFAHMDNDDWRWPLLDNIRVQAKPATDAWGPYPDDKAINVGLSPDKLMWEPGLWADKHEVYFGTSFDDVSNRDESVHVGFLLDANSYGPVGLELDKEYYWCVDEVNDSYEGSVDPEPGPWYGPVWRFKTNDGKTRNPSPLDGAPVAAPDTVLSWEPGIVAARHDVYFGANFDDVNDANALVPLGVYRGSEDVFELPPDPYDPNRPERLAYDAGALEDLKLGMVYYWRVDAANDTISSSPWKGHVWSFTASDYEQIDVNNPSFELNIYGEQIADWQTTNWDTIAGWDGDGSWIGVELWTNPGPTEGNAALKAERNDTYCYQVFDHNIIEDKKYIVNYDLATWDTVGITATATFFYDDDGEHVDISSTPVELTGDMLGTWQDTTATFVAEAGMDCIGEKLGVKFVFESDLSGLYSYVDDVHLGYESPVMAWGPYPSDGAVNVHPAIERLSWSSGILADEHGVYFGTDLEAVQGRDSSVYVIPQDANSYELTEELEMDTIYYWAIDEHNDAYTGTDPVAGPWYGRVWRFRTNDGRAYNPNPANLARNVNLGVELSWTEGILALQHDVYFGTDFDDVNDANIFTDGIYRDRFDLEVNSYDSTGEFVYGNTYYWRVDEINSLGLPQWPGHVWNFQISEYGIVDNFELYDDDNLISYDGSEGTWIDYVENESGAEVYLETDANYTRHGNGMRYRYNNYYLLSEIEGQTYAGSGPQDYLDIDPNWVAGRGKALALWFRGSPENEPEQLYVALEDAMGEVAVVPYDGDLNDLKLESWRQWNIALDDFTGIDLAEVEKIYIGFGDRDNQTSGGMGIVYFDDIHLYPARCLPDYAYGFGSFNQDCLIDLEDLKAVARDWLVTEIGTVTAKTEPSDANLIGHWPMDDNEGGTSETSTVVLDVSGNENDGTLYDSDGGGENTTKAHSVDGIDGTALEFDGENDYVELPALDSSSNTITITAWIKRELQYPGHIYDGIVMSSNAYNPDGPAYDPNYTAGLQFGSDTDTWLPNYELSFMWTGYSWEWHSRLFVPSEEWTFTALAVAPDVAIIYLYDGVSLQAARNYDTYEPLPWDAPFRVADQMQFGPDSGRFFPGEVDDVRIYDYTLSPEEILYLALWGPGSQYLPLEPWRADASGDKVINLKDYAIMAENWLNEILFPPD